MGLFWEVRYLIPDLFGQSSVAPLQTLVKTSPLIQKTITEVQYSSISIVYTGLAEDLPETGSSSPTPKAHSNLPDRHRHRLPGPGSKEMKTFFGWGYALGHSSFPRR